MSERKLVSSSSLKLLILVLVGAFVLASSSTATAQSANFDWYDSTALYSRITTVRTGPDYETHNVTNNFSTSSDNMVSVGKDLYMVFYNPNSPWNTSLMVSSDRGVTWTNKGEVTAGAGLLTTARLNALAYDEAGTIHIGYGVGWDVWYRNYTVSTGIFSASNMIYDGHYNSHEIRAYWDEVHDTIWFTRYGGSPVSGSMRNPTVMRRHNGVWESYRNNYDTAWSGARQNDITWADGRMYWIMMDYQATVTSRRMYAWELDNYDDITSWIGLGGLGLPSWVHSSGNTGCTSFDIGTTKSGFMVVSVENLKTLGEEYIQSFRWDASSKTWDGPWTYNLTGWSPASQPQFHAPKMFYDNDGVLNMGIIVEQDAGYSLVYNDWVHFQTWEPAPPNIRAKVTGHVMNFLGGDMHPYSAPVAPYIPKLNENNTLGINWTRTTTPENWLFEYEDYHIDVHTVNCNETISWVFGLKDGNITGTYNRTTGAVVASDAEQIEIIKVVATESAGNKTHFDIHFLLTQNVADQLNVPVYISATGRWGPINETLVNTVQIYNEGGLTNYSFVGWAGREDAAHPFEIFSADTRTPTLIDPYGFDVRTGPLTVNEDESGLIEEIRADWEINLPYRTALADMYPTHRLDSYADPSDRGYYTGSYPFSFLIKDNQVDANRMLYMEKTFRRIIREEDKELVSVQWAAMNPDTGLYAGQYRVQDQSIKLEGSAYMAVQIRFNSSDGLQFYNSSSANWEEIQVVADYDWELIRCDFNLTTQLVNITVDSVLKVENAPFVDALCTELGAFFMGTINSVTTTNKFYTDVVHAWTDFDLPLGGQAEVTQVYRKLQSWDMHLGYGIEAPDGVADAAMEQGYIEFGVDYMFGSVWVPEFSVRITPNATELNKRNNWIKYKVEWNHTSTGAIVKTDFIYGLYEADTKLGSEFLQREITSLFADFWVDQANSSSIVGGRVNVEWYGISDKAPWYQFWGQEWKPKITDIDRSQILMPLMDENGTIRQAFEIDLCRIWATSYRTDVGTFHHKITQISQFETNEVLGLSRFEGQDTPYFNEPKTPAMSNAGLFGPVYALIGAIGRMIVTALISASNGFIGLADSMLTFLGLPTGFFHTIVGFLGLIPVYIVDLMVMVGTALNQLLGFITPLFTFITYLMTFGLGFLGQLIGKQLEFWRLVVDIFQGGAGMPFNFWVDFNLQAFITLGLVMLPITAMERWTNARDPTKTAMEDIGFAMSVVQFVIGFFKGIADLLSQLVSLILELIPA